ncbi:DUF1127 domain-containing protein [Roseomonas sp. BN140053]|uniref:DUF1127 domain-containing protein n=1 Tax=Roseomonas sp. BN140053 TaxID=3391898 RepID=UPI0039EC8F90
MSAHATPAPYALGAHAPAGRGKRATAWWGIIVRSLQAIESRRLLAQMDDRMLSDVGMSRSDALREAARAPWDVGPQQRI